MFIVVKSVCYLVYYINFNPLGTHNRILQTTVIQITVHKKSYGSLFKLINDPTMFMRNSLFEQGKKMFEQGCPKFISLKNWDWGIWPVDDGIIYEGKNYVFSCTLDPICKQNVEKCQTRQGHPKERAGQF